MKYIRRALLILSLFQFASTTLWAGLDDLDDLNGENQTPEPEQKKPEKNKLNYDEELQSGEIKSKPIPKAKQDKPDKGAKKDKPEKRGYVSQKKVKTKPETDKNAEKQPVQIKSKGLRALKNEGVLELKENVVITQGNLLLTADYAKVYSSTTDDKQVEKIFVKGNVKISKKSDDPEERVVARGDEAIFYNKTRKVILSGNARLWRGGDLIKGKKIDYDMNTGWITVDSAEGLIDPERSIESE